MKTKLSYLNFPLRRTTLLTFFFIAGWTFSIFGQTNTPTGTHQTFTIPSGTTYLGVAILKPAVLRGTVAAVLSNTELSIQVTGESAPNSKDTLFLEITSCPADSSLEGERFFLGSGDKINSATSKDRILTILPSPENTRSSLPPALAGASFIVFPAWTLVDLFGGGTKPIDLLAQAGENRIALLEPYSASTGPSSESNPASWGRIDCSKTQRGNVAI